MDQTVNARPPISPLRRGSVQWVALLALLGVEYWLFLRGITQFHTWVYPRWNDQIQYLTEAYTSYEVLRTQGWWAGLREALTNPAAQGTLHDVLAVVVFGIFGPSRAAALSLNFGAFAAWQALSFALWRRATGRWSIAWLAVLLLLALRSLTEAAPGSPIDFRLDWMACCLAGAALACGGLTDGFRRTGWSIAFGAAIGLTIVARFLTLIYFGALLVALALWLLTTLRKKDAWTGLARLGRLLVAGAVCAAVCAPFLWMNWETVYNYYWIGHLTGPESAIRSPNFGLQRSFDFIFREALWDYHVGGFALRTIGAGLLAVVTLIATRLWWDERRSRSAADDVPVHRVEASLWLGALMLIIPGGVLVLHSQKSHLVVSILLPGFVALAVGIVALAARRFLASARARLAVGVVVLAMGTASFWHFARGFSTSPHSPEFSAGAAKVQQLAGYIYDTSRAAKLATPRIGVDQVTDSLDAQITRVVSYERHGEWTPYIMTLPTGIAEDQEANLFSQLAQSNFVFLTEEMPGEGGWPYDRQMRRLYPRLREWCETHLRRVETFSLFDRKMTLYQGRELPVIEVATPGLAR